MIKEELEKMTHFFQTMGGAPKFIVFEAILGNQLPIGVTKISTDNIINTCDILGGIAYNIGYLNEAKDTLIEAIKIYGSWGSEVNHKGDIYAIDEIIKYIDEKIKEATHINERLNGA